MFIRDQKHKDFLVERGEWGIDKIKIYLNSASLNITALNDATWYVSNDNTYLLHFIAHSPSLLIEKLKNGYYFLIINHEFFSKNLPGELGFITMQIKAAIDKLMYAGLIRKGTTYKDVIHHITELEFFFDFRENNISVIEDNTFLTREDAIENAGLYRYGDTDTFYSYNGYEVSSICFYDKRQKDLNDNHFSKHEIEQHPFTKRLEFRLRGPDVEDTKKLAGHLNTVFTNYLDTLAFLHNKYIKNNFVFNIPVRNKYVRIIKRSEEVTSIRNTRR